MALSEENIRKRLSTLNSTQDSIQTASLWILHYKDTAIDKVAKCWMDVYRDADDKLRVALIYLMNDVVQNVKKKEHSDAVKMAFHPHVVNACGLANDVVKKAIIRCVDVFAQRHVFPSHIVEEMRAALGVYKKHKPVTDYDDGLSEVDYAAMIRSIESYGQNEELTEKARNILERSNFNFKEKMQERMKDRAEGSKILKEMDESKNKLVQFLNSVERHQNKCKRLMDVLKSAKAALNLQLRDVTIVDDAYEKFENGILETRKQLKAKMDSGDLIVNSSPPRDAPSPLPTDDPFSFEGGSGDDMEMDDDDMAANTSTNVNSASSFIRPQLSQPRQVIEQPPPVISSSPKTSATSALDPRLQRLLKNQRGGNTLNQADQREINAAMGGVSAVSPNDPRRRPRMSADTPTPTNGNSPRTPQLSQSQYNNNMGTPASTSRRNDQQQIFSPSTNMKAMNIDTSNPPPFFTPSHGALGGPLSPNVPPPIMYSPHNPPPFGFPPPNATSIMSYLPPPHMLPPPPLTSSHPPRFMPTSAYNGNDSSAQKRMMKRKFPQTQ